MNKKRLLLLLAALCLASPGNTAFAAKQPPLKKKKSTSFTINTCLNCEKNLGNSGLEQEFFLCKMCLKKASNKPSASITCFKCRNIITKQFTTLQGKTFCLKCSSQCARCNHLFSLGDCIGTLDDTPFCSACSACSKCKRSLTCKANVRQWKNNTLTCNDCFKCDKCNTRATDLFISIDETNEVPSFFCHECYKCTMCRTKKSKDEKISFIGTIDRDPIFCCTKCYQCTICSKKLPRKKRIFIHQEEKNGTSIFTMYCNKCCNHK